jgi:hypothetical protein
LTKEERDRLDEEHAKVESLKQAVVESEDEDATSIDFEDQGAINEAKTELSPSVGERLS